MASILRPLIRMKQKPLGLAALLQAKSRALVTKGFLKTPRPLSGEHKDP
ncbi:hypothetical protein CF149_02444 [Pseudomonas psychrophila]|nr:hypothetical protein CF149_02444 [Pseudomonas psychrophila]